MAALPVASGPARSRYLCLLQIAGVLNVVAYHLGLPFTRAGFLVVDIFFVVAGMNMASALARSPSLSAYVSSRIGRLAPEMLAVWCVAVGFLLAGSDAPGLLLFVATSPVFLYNLVRAFFEYPFPMDTALGGTFWLFAHLWFVAALMQLQLVAFALRRPLLRARPWVVMVAALGIATLSRTLFAAVLGRYPTMDLSVSQAEVLYVLPFAHLEALVLGILMGNGAFPRIARTLPWLALLVVTVFVTHVAAAADEITVKRLMDAIEEALGLGFEYPLRSHYAQIWGYAIVAVAAGSLASRNWRLAEAVDRRQFPAWADRILFRLGSLIYGVYVFHGVILATGINAAALLARPNAPGLRGLLFVITATEAFLLAWGFQTLRQRVRARRVSGVRGSQPPRMAGTSCLYSGSRS